MFAYLIFALRPSNSEKLRPHLSIEGTTKCVLILLLRALFFNDRFQSFKFFVLDSLFSRHATCKVYGWIFTNYQRYSVIRIYQLTANYRMELYSYLTLNV